MPIRINLLAEAQAAEELRRKDPVKRALIMGVGFVILMTIVSLAIQLQVVRTKSETGDYAKQIRVITNQYSVVMENKQQFEQVNLNIRGLDILASERFLNGTLLNALQKVYVDHVQLVHIRVDQTYTMTEETRDKTTKKVTKPGTSAERITLFIEARDASPNPGDQVNKYKEALSQSAFIKSLIGTDNEMRLVNLSPPQIAGDLNRPVVQFTLECRLPEKVRLAISSPTRYGTPSTDAKATAAKKPAGPVKL